MTEEPIEHELLRQVLALAELKVLHTEVEHFMENTRVRITLHEDPSILGTCALGLIFALGALSFHDARPRGNSGMHFEGDDEWQVGDLVRHLTFEKGRLQFDADYVRGRCMKTTVEVHPDGKVVLETMNRGESATRWVSKLQGKKVLTLVDADAETDPAEPSGSEAE